MDPIQNCTLVADVLLADSKSPFSKAVLVKFAICSAASCSDNESSRFNVRGWVVGAIVGAGDEGGSAAGGGRAAAVEEDASPPLLETVVATPIPRRNLSLRDLHKKQTPQTNSRPIEFQLSANQQEEPLGPTPAKS